MKQQTLAMAVDQSERFERERRPARREEFLATKDHIVPWAELCAVIEPHYPKAGNGRPPVGLAPIRLMARLLCPQRSFKLSDEELVKRWAENVQWPFFSGSDDYQPRLPCDPTQIGRFRRLLGEDGIEQLFKATVECAVQIKAVLPADLERGNRRLDRAVQGDCPAGRQPAAGDRAPQGGERSQKRRHRLSAARTLA